MAKSYVKFRKWAHYNSSEIAVSIVFGLILAGVVFGVLAVTSNDHKKLLASANAYHYSVGQKVYCDRPDQSDNGRNWEDCTILVHNYDYTSYIVQYKSGPDAKDNISPLDIQRVQK